MIKKLLCMVLSAFIIFGTLCGYAEEYQPSDILYSNDFNSGNLNLAYNRVSADNSKIELAQLDDSHKGVMSFYGDGTQNTKLYRQAGIKFSQVMKAGDTFAVSYDFYTQNTGAYPFMLYTSKSNGNSATWNDQYVTVANSDVAAANGKYGYYKTTNAAAPSAWTPQKICDIVPDTWMHMDIVTTLTSGGREYTFFVDGEKVGSWTNTYTADVAGVMFSNTLMVSKESQYYVDNVVVKKLYEPYAQVTVEGNGGGNTVIAEFSDTFTQEALEKVAAPDVITLDKNSNAVEAGDVTANGNLLIVTYPNGLDYDTNYTIEFNGLTDMFARTIKPIGFSSLSEVDEDGNVVLRIKDVRAQLFDGTYTELQNVVPADIKSFVFYLNTRIDVYEGGITLNGESLNLAYNEDEKTLTADLNGLLIGGKEYTINVNDLIKTAQGISIKPYTAEFKTNDGNFKVTDIKWVDTDGNEADVQSLSDGETVYLAYSAINTTDTDKEFTVTYNAICAESMTAFDSKTVTVKSGEYQSGALEYVYSAGDEVCAGFVCDSFKNLKFMCDPVFLKDGNITESESDIRCTVQKSNIGNDKFIAFQVYEPDMSYADGVHPIYQNAVRVSEKTANAAFAVTSKTSGLYNIYTTPADKQSTAADYMTYNYINSQKNADALLWLNSINGVPSEEEFNAYCNDLGFHSKLTDDIKDRVLSNVYSSVSAKEFANTDTQKTLNGLNKLYAAAMLNAGKYVNVFANGDLTDAATAKFTNYGFIGDNLIADANERIAGYALNQNITTVSDFDRNVICAFVLAAVKYSDGYENARAVMTEFADKIGVSAGDITVKAANAVSGNNYDTYEQLKQAIEKANQQGGSGSGSGSGGGGTRKNSDIKNVNIDLDTGSNTNGANTVFNDIKGVKWAQSAIESLYKKGIINGMGNGKFMPSGNVTREQFAKMAVTAFSSVNGNVQNNFADVDENDWFCTYVNTAFENGILNGTGENMFGTGAFITREDMAVIIYNCAKLKGITLKEGSLTVSDENNISDYAKIPVSALLNSGIVNGTGSGEFNPKGFATRAEAAKMIYMLLEYNG